MATLAGSINMGKIGDLIKRLSRQDAGLGDNGLKDGREMSNNPWKGIHNFANVSVNLTFDLRGLDEDAEVDAVQFDAIPIMHLLLDVKDDIQFIINILGDELRQPITTTITTGELRVKVWKAWSNIQKGFLRRIRDKWDNARSDLRLDGQKWDIIRSFPEIWLTGAGAVHFTKYPLETTPGLDIHARNNSPIRSLRRASCMS